jgi:hypothetical protein
MAILHYLSDKDFPVAGGGASVAVPSEDPLFKHIQLAKFQAARDTAVAKAATTAAPAPAARAPALPPPRPVDAWDDEYDEYGDGAGAEGPYAPPGAGAGGRVVAGVFMPSVSAFIQQTSAPMASLKYNANGSAKGSSTSAGNSGILSTRELLAAGGGGKPVDLPPAPKGPKRQAKNPPPAPASGAWPALGSASASASGPKAASLAGSGKKASSSGNAGAASASASGSGTSASGSEAAEAKPAAPLLPVTIEKKDVVKETLQRCSPYYAVVSADGNQSSHCNSAMFTIHILYDTIV